MSLSPIHIAIDASRSTTATPTGTETYSLRLSQALIAANESAKVPLRFSLYFRDRPSPGLHAESEHVDIVPIPFPRLWTHLRFAAALWRSRPDLTFVPAHSLPLAFPGRAIVTVHDLGFKRFPAAHPPAQRAYLDATTRFSQARADLIFADSQATAADLIRFYSTPVGKIRVIFPGVDAEALKTTAQAVEAVRAKYELPPRYFLFIGTLQPRKNIKGIVQAFQLWQRNGSGSETGLVLAGGKGWLFDDAWLEGARRVHRPGYVSESDKAALLAGALALVFPSLYEGFGFPAVEAMIAGTPVIASNTSSLAEIVGEAGLQVDPLDHHAIASAMRRVSDDERLRRELIHKGYLRAKQFTWESAAEQALSVFRELGAPA